jgi:2-keto-4-pentenoate hydratase/2-oxohepta-3-ene-1,7-dioic acid hydratase in catechol pathway
MKLASFNDGRLGVIVDDAIVDITDLSGVAADFWPPVGMVRLISLLAEATSRVQDEIAARPSLPLNTVRLDAPIQWPNKVIAFPANYHAHIDEMKAVGALISKAPASGQGFFLKAGSSISGPSDPIVLPPIANREIHHEMELGIIIGRRGRGVAAAEAARHVFGFTCLLDMVVRGKEERVMRKSFDTFCPTGPWIVTADEVPDWSQIKLRLTVNGEERQAATTANLIVDIPDMIAMSSAVMTLEPGDIIASGTPAGVGPVRDGDVIEISIENVGSMRLDVKAGSVGDHPIWSFTQSPQTDTGKVN